MKVYEGWDAGVPPTEWQRILMMDVGGSSANVLEWLALDPVSKSIVFYNEIYKVTTDMRMFADMALPYMKDSKGQEYNFLAKVGDYENKIALADMGKYGITFTNAVKQNKIVSVHRLAGYLHPNPNRHFPSWHPRAGQLGAPLMYIAPSCKHLIEELPQQRWKSERGGTDLKDEMDRSVKHDAVDCALYGVRILPAPTDVPVATVKPTSKAKSLQSQLYWEDAKRHQEKQSANAPRTAYNPTHMGGLWG
jgi:hypothetical protein